MSWSKLPRLLCVYVRKSSMRPDGPKRGKVKEGKRAFQSIGKIKPLFTQSYPPASAHLSSAEITIAEKMATALLWTIGALPAQSLIAVWFLIGETHRGAAVDASLNPAASALRAEPVAAGGVLHSCGNFWGAGMT